MMTGKRGQNEAITNKGRLAVKVAARQSLPRWLLQGMLEATLAASADQLPVVILHLVATHHADDLVVMTLDDFQGMVWRKW